MASQIHIGPLPPPLGGVSVYLSRLQKAHPEYLVMNLMQMSKLDWLKLVFFSDCEVVLHGCFFKWLILFRLFSAVRKQPYSLGVHGQGLMGRYRANLRGKWIVRYALGGCKHIYVDAEHLKNDILSEMPEYISKVVIKNPFLPPSEDEEDSILATYSEDIKCFMSNHSPLLVANAYQLAEWKNIHDLYGLDLCVELVRRLRSDYPQVGLLFALANDQYRIDYYNDVRQRIKDYHIEDNICFLTGQRELWPVFKRATIMVRPTCTDGNSVSIQEALALHCPVVASDVCPRPEGTVVFANRDVQDFEQKVRFLLEKLKGDISFDKNEIL